MAEEAEKPTNPREIFIVPVITFVKAIGLFFDVSTLMIRLLFNTVAHDTPHGKLETAEAREARERE